MSTSSSIGITRRQFLKSAATAGAAIAAGPVVGALADPKPRFLLGGFTKELQELKLDQLADVAAEMGWDGIEIAVRPKGHILPERAEEDLPKLVDALKKRNLRVLFMVTAIRTPADPHAQAILRTAGKLGITHYRMGYWKYDDRSPIPQQLDAIKPQLRELAAFNNETGVCALYQNHSGRDYVGAPVWDVRELLKDIDPKQIGSQFDIGHATLEGGNAWRTSWQLMRPHVGAVTAKDFTWKVTPGKGGTSNWCPLGEGMVNPAFFELVKKSGFSGPVTVHVEYDSPGADAVEKRKNHIAALKRDTGVLRHWIAG